LKTESYYVQRMKRIALFIFTVCLLNSCDIIDELTKFNMEYNSTVEIESTANLNLPFDVFTPDVETNSESEFEVNDTRKDLIEDIRLRKLDLDITSPSDQDFSFLESVEIFISAEGLQEIRIAYMDEVPETIGNLISLDVEDVDIKEYIKKDKFNLRLNTVTDEVLTNDCSIAVKCIFFVDAKILGI
jgi:hypothetical protein